MKKKILIVLAVFAVALVAVSLNGKITGNAFAYNLQQSCIDSDGGSNPYEQGTGEYKGRSSAKLISFTDKCNNPGNLLEHYCDGKIHLTETIPCRCENGVCKK